MGEARFLAKRVTYTSEASYTSAGGAGGGRCEPPEKHLNLEPLRVNI